MSKFCKVLQVTAVDATVEKLLLPLTERLRAEGYQVHIACSDGQYVPELRERGYDVHTVTIERRINPISNFRSFWQLYRLMKRERFDVVHVHTPVAAVLGRIAAWVARVPIIIYTAHGFYFHDGMPGWIRQPVIWLEKLLGYITDLIFTQSYEDATTALREKICPHDKLQWIGNGVDIARFTAKPGSNGIRESLGICKQDKVVGFVGRLVREKGILELIEATKTVVKTIPDARLLLVGDTLDSDRDTKVKQDIGRLLDEDGFASRVIFAGFMEDMPGVMADIDLFVLPSYREGMPRTIIEAMACGKPVIATNIRGCREEVVPDLTGLLVPVGDSAALAEAITSVLRNSKLAHKMGDVGRKRVCELFDENLVLNRQMSAYAEVVRRKLTPEVPLIKSLAKKRIKLGLKRLIDVALSSISLIALCLPFTIFGILIKFDSPGPVFFRQERMGKGGKPFKIWKFRTMIDNAVEHGLGLNVAEDDPRFTRVGKALRNWGLDELPQLINVFKGDMSVIGPRPTIRLQVEQYSTYQRQRLLLKPGITSLAVVMGRNLLSWRQRIRLDVWYIKNWSLWLDVVIIFKTLWAVLVARKGVYGADGINDAFVASGVVRQGQDS